MENNLYAFILLFVLVIFRNFWENKNYISFTLIGFIFTLIRSEAIIYIIPIYLILIVQLVLYYFLKIHESNSDRGLVPFLKSPRTQKLLKSLILFSLLTLSFYTIRYLIYSTIFPNSYYGKIGKDLISSAYITNFLKLYFPLFLIMMIIITTFLALFLINTTIRLVLKQNSKNVEKTDRFKHKIIKLKIKLANFLDKSKTFKDVIIIITGLMLILSNIIIVLISVGTWWGPGRYFTVLLVCIPLISDLLLYYCINLLNKIVLRLKNIVIKKKQKDRSLVSPHLNTILKAVLIMIYILLSIHTDVYFYILAKDFREGKPPNVFYERVKANAEYANHFGGYLLYNEYVHSPKEISFITVDLGATSYYAQNYTIIDLGRIGNPMISHSKKDYTDPYVPQYIFNVSKPPIILIKCDWSYMWRFLEMYPKFNEDYAPIEDNSYIYYRKVLIPNGWFIRRDIFQWNHSESSNGSDLVYLKGYDLNSRKFLNGGVMDLKLFLQRNESLNLTYNTSINSFNLIYLKKHTLNEIYILENTLLFNGYYKIIHWPANNVVLEKRILNIDGLPIGNYSLNINISIGTYNYHFNLGDIEIMDENSLCTNKYINDSLNILNFSSSNLENIANELNSIRAFNTKLYQEYWEYYLYLNYKYIEQIAHSEPELAYNKLRGIAYVLIDNHTVGIERLNAINIVSENLIQVAHSFENKDIKKSLLYYEYVMWLQPKNSRLRHYICLLMNQGCTKCCI
ncbi:MAG: hypothetical protein ACTSU2_08850 [Promethearchaeota archaeon]